jgi:hypothetical protein
MGLRPTQGHEKTPSVQQPLSIEPSPFPLSSRVAEGSAVQRTFPGNAGLVHITKLSSRPECSAVERSAVSHSA